MKRDNPLYVVLGLGKTGWSCVNYLRQQGHSVAVLDSRESPPFLSECRRQFPEIRLEVGGLDRPLLTEASVIVASPGVSLQHPAIEAARARGVEIIGDVELFARAAKAAIIAITGSNGKTTVTTWVGELLQAAGRTALVCGNIGLPVLEALAQPVPDFYVLEISSFQLDTTQSLAAKTAVVLNVSADHMDRYAGYEDYLHSKQRIYHHCQHPVVPAFQQEIWRPLLNGQKAISFGLAEGEFHVQEINGARALAFRDQPLLAVSAMKLQGEHHLLNALAALALVHAVGVEVTQVTQVIAQFAGLPHRCQWVAERAGVAWINDSKGTNVGASVAALMTVGAETTGKIILIAGGDAKQADLSPLRAPVQQFVGHLVLIGKDTPLFVNTLQDIVSVTCVDSLPEAVSCAARIAKQGDKVLLSPASASLDMFQNYEHRGQVFVEAVQGLLHE